MRAGSLAAAGAAAGAALLAVAVAVLDELPGEMALLRAARVGPDATAYGLAQGVDALTGTWPLLAIAVLLGIVLRAVQVPAAVALAAVVTAGAKRLVARERPDLSSSLAEASPFSFPAGHAAAAAALVLAVLLVAPRGRRAGVAVTGGGVLLISALAQLALARHFPSDLLAGWLTGGAVAATLTRLRRPGTSRDG